MMVTPRYYAHSTETTDKSDWQPLTDHLRNVATLSGQFAGAFQAAQWGYYAGLLHDAGKACQKFLMRLEGKAVRCDHASFGAKLAVERGGNLAILLAYAICGHHGGLPDGGLQEGQLHHRLRKENVSTEPPDEVNCLESLRFPFQLEKNSAIFSMAFFSRMLFSCLVDADFLDTEAFCNPEKTTLRETLPQENFEKLRGVLQSYISKKQAAAKPGKVNDARQRVLAHCIAQAKEPRGCYSLTVPTGGGKTLSSLAFAVEHAAVHGLRRVIYAIPFTSIIEQNAEVIATG